MGVGDCYLSVCTHVCVCVCVCACVRVCVKDVRAEQSSQSGSQWKETGPPQLATINCNIEQKAEVQRHQRWQHSHCSLTVARACGGPLSC